MDEQSIQDLLSRLWSLKYRSKDSSYLFDVISHSNRNLVEETVRMWANEMHDSKIGTLEAKCFAYEQIIRNSNFAPILGFKEGEPKDG